MADLRGYSEYARFASLALSWVLTTAVLLYGGYRVGSWLDARWHTAPFLTALGLLGAVALGLASLVIEADQLLNQPARRAGRRREATGASEPAGGAGRPAVLETEPAGGEEPPDRAEGREAEGAEPESPGR